MRPSGNTPLIPSKLLPQQNVHALSLCQPPSHSAHSGSPAQPALSACGDHPLCSSPMPVRAAWLAAIMDSLHHAPPGSVSALTPLLLPAANGGYVRWYPAVRPCCPFARLTACIAAPCCEQLRRPGQRQRPLFSLRVMMIPPHPRIKCKTLSAPEKTSRQVFKKF